MNVRFVDSFVILKYMIVYCHIPYCLYLQTGCNQRIRGRPGRDGTVVGFITTYAIGAYHH